MGGMLPVKFSSVGFWRLLNFFGVNTDSWGSGESHTPDHFLSEIERKESWLCIDGKGISRFLEVVKVIIKDAERGTLLEDYQILPDGHRKGRGQTPGGKIAVGESPIAALAREIYEELGLVPDDYGYQQLQGREEEKPSKSYPGLRCVYKIYPFAVTLKPHVQIEDGYMTIDKEDGKKLFFRWSKE